MSQLREKYADILGIESEEGEVVTNLLARDVKLSSGKTLALLTLDNGRDYKRPNTLGPQSMVSIGETLLEQRARAAAGEIDALAITGKRFNFCAGADLSMVGDIPNRDAAYKLAQIGHEVLGMLNDFPVPTFAFYNGLALGGGVEVGLNANYRTIDSSVPAFGLPETFLGIVPGWGGATIVPNLIGIENALKVIIENPMKQNRLLKGPQAYELGLADAMFEPRNFLEDSLKWADGVISGEIKVKRKNAPGRLERMTKWDIAIGIAKRTLEDKIGTVPLAPYRALEIMKAAKSNDREAGFELENQALACLLYTSPSPRDS